MMNGLDIEAPVCHLWLTTTLLEVYGWRDLVTTLPLQPLEIGDDGSLTSGKRYGLRKGEVVKNSFNGYD